VVTYDNKRAKLQKRRAISSVVGGAIFLVLFLSAISTFFVAMDVQRDTINTQRTISDSIMKKTQEQFSIAVSTDAAQNNLLGIQVKNQGTNPVEIGNIWIINNSGNYPAEKHLIDYSDSIIPPGYGSNILENTPLHLTVVDDYDIKVISTLGTVKKVEYTVGAGNNLRAELLAIPPDVKVGQNVTLTMHVENIGETRILNVQPVGTGLPTIVPAFTPPDPPVPIPINLDPGEGVFFTWKYVTTGAAGTPVDISSQATGTEEDIGYIVNSNVATTAIELREPDDSEIIVLNQDLLSRPEIFMVIPGPFGDTLDLGVWGVNVVNPTAQTMNVSKITISAINPSDEDDDEFFDQGDCNTADIPPTAPGQWDCNLDNQMTWEPQGSPVQIPPLSVESFLVFAQPGSLVSSGKDLHTALIQTHVFTSSGEFGKGSYGSSMKAGGSSMVNVYLSDVYPGTGDPNDIISSISGVSGGTSVAFNVTLSEFEGIASHKISNSPDKAKLIINIPKGWSNVIVKESSGFDYVKYSGFADGSSQLVGFVTDELEFGHETIKFRATAPSVTSTQMYVMYILADGVTDSGWNLGALGEIVIQVLP